MNAYLEKKCVDRTERHIYFPEKPDGSVRSWKEQYNPIGSELRFWPYCR